ncbi:MULTISPECIES: hypothetical protein [Bacillus amyloliquefaciens group]|uniref:hypothetical protein n=1 Tax=Bacillus amyloliquefaciens group TaxID=1938374 RepID=UPI000CA1BC4A|nr:MULTISPECIES: hypothetical protein [Bacillus amyloliquefaciens group]ATX83547.1 hypothetical protein CU084_04205 [Bacillus velezensis]QCC34923.1 hypothetical protein E4T61_02635 [Bacillus velezensis]
MSNLVLNTFSSFSSICYPKDLKEAADLNAAKFQIYMIIRIPKITIDSNALKVFRSHIELVLKFKTDFGIFNETIKCQFSHDRDHTMFDYEIDKLGKTLKIKDGTDEVTLRALFLQGKFSRPIPAEVLYIGRAYGKNGNRTAFDRLKSHESLQRILADHTYEEVIGDIAIALFEINAKLIGEFIDMTNPSEDLFNLESVLLLKDPIAMNQVINITEAALINFFKPKYNDILKNNFPDKTHTSYKEFFKLRYTSVTVEVDQETLNIRLFTKYNKYNPYDLITYVLTP